MPYLRVCRRRSIDLHQTALKVYKLRKHVILESCQTLTVILSGSGFPDILVNIMTVSKNATPVVKNVDLPINLRPLVLASIKADDKNEGARNTLYAAMFKVGILPSQKPAYAKAFQSISRSTFPKKVQEAVVSKILRKDDIVRGVKSDLEGKLLSKVAWQNQINRKASRCFTGYDRYLLNHEAKIEVHGKLQPAAVADKLTRSTRIPTTEKSLHVQTIEKCFPLQSKWSDIKSPTTIEIENAKDLMRILDRTKSADKEALALFNRLSVPTKK